VNSPANDLNLLRKLYSEQNWPQLTQAAAAISGRQPQNGEALRYLGIGELMTMRGGPDKLLRASLLNDNEAGLWLAVLQEFSAHPPASVAPGDLPAQVEFSKLRRSPYMDYPQEVHIETLAICNAACTFCPYPHMDRQGDRMPDELIDKIIDDLRKVPTNVPFHIAPFKVNEPFLDKRIFSVCAKINAVLPNAKLRLFTNGSPLTEKIVENAAAVRNVAHLWISLNEVEAEAYEKLMGLPLDRTLAKLDMLHTLVRDKRFPHPVQISRVTDGTERDRAFLTFVQQRYPLFKPFMIGAGNWTGQVDVATERRVPPAGCFRWFELSIMASGKVACAAWMAKASTSSVTSTRSRSSTSTTAPATAKCGNSPSPAKPRGRLATLASISEARALAH
jgi:Radical SAM superfamily